MSRNISNSELSALAEKVLNGTASSEEKEILNQWYTDFNDQEVTITSGENSAQIKQRLLLKIKSDLHTNNSNQSGKWKIVASITLVLASALIVFLFNQHQSAKVVFENHNKVIKHADFGQKRLVRLPDGSLVKLNAGSSIEYDSLFIGDIRKVTLDGEAFFEVKRDESKPFVIHTSELQVKVLGTSFNIRSYPEETQTDVAVKTGRVMVRKLTSSDVLDLRPNEMAAFNNLSGNLLKQNIESPGLVFGWTEGNLIMQDETFDVVMGKISRWYNVRMQLENPGIKDKKITANLTDPTLKEVMESLSHTYKFDYKINGDVVTIR